MNHSIAPGSNLTQYKRIRVKGTFAVPVKESVYGHWDEETAHERFKKALETFGIKVVHLSIEEGEGV